MSQQPSWWSGLRHWVPPLLSICLLAASGWAIWQELRTYRPEQLLSSLAALPVSALGLGLLLTMGNYLVMVGYEVLAIRYIRHPLVYRQAALVACISHAVSNIVGLGLLSSSAIRYRFYLPWNFSALDVVNIIAFCNISFLLGLLTVSGVMFVWHPITIPAALHLPFDSVRPLGGLCMGLIIVYVLWNTLSQRSLRIGSWELPHLSLQLCLAQLTVAALDWIFSALVFYALLTAPIAFPNFFATYLLAQVAGLISNVPGGLGVFETVMLLLLSPAISPAQLFAVLLAYRCIYYFIPLGAAIMVLGFYELRQRRVS
jgi:uncharacterized membrane protein YbhN (UPF0104 family)